MKKSDTPYLSFVVTARNDNHGGDFLKRMQIFVHGLLEQARRHRVHCELIIVEWNPPAGKPLLAEALSWSPLSPYCSVRIIEVPPHIHNEFDFSEGLALYQMIAKNVGIRRAKGEFVLATNIDLLYSDRLFQAFASRSLRKGMMYRIDRLDAPANIPVSRSLDEQLSFCKKNVIRVNARTGTFNVIRASLELHIKLAISKVIGRTVQSIKWVFEYFVSWLPEKRTAKDFFSIRNVSSFTCNRLNRLGRISTKISKKIRSIKLAGKEAALKSRLHTNGCGDFTLLARSDWAKTQAYPELEMFSIHIDSLFCNLADMNGIKEMVFKERGMHLFHIEHASGWSPEHIESTLNRMRNLGVPVIDNEYYDSLIARLRSEGGKNFFNTEDWGLANESLKETVIGFEAAPSGVPSLR